MAVNVEMRLVEQSFPGDRIEDVEEATLGSLAAADKTTGGFGVKAGARIAVAVGSRGVANLQTIVTGVVRWLKSVGATPFVVPAMGSHGGATAEGQREVLGSYGVTEGAVGAPVISSMETVQIPASDVDIPVYMDKHAFQADGVILINRVKPHTDFTGFPESGLIKMAVIGLGKHAQALSVHSLGIVGLTTKILPVGRALLATDKILGGVAIVENGYDETMHIEAIPALQIEERERVLLEVARSSMPHLPVDDIDLLIVDEIGKDISGTCMDTNIIGRRDLRGQEEPESPRVKSIVAMGLTEASHGNAIGFGLADVITQKLRDQVDLKATYENAVTSSFYNRTKIPLTAVNDADAIDIALRAAALGPDREKNYRAARIVRIKNTLEISRVLVSESLVAELGERPNLSVSEKRIPLFDDSSITVW